MESDIVLAETRRPVALVTLNRPDKLNALDYALIDRHRQVARAQIIAIVIPAERA